MHASLSPHHLADAELIHCIVGGPLGDPARLLHHLMHESHDALDAALGPRRARRLRAAVELGRRVSARLRRNDGRLLPHAEAVFAWAEERLLELDHEELWMLAVNAKQRLRSARLLAKGGALGLSVSTRDVLREVLREGAPAFVLVHNHPSGDPTPSAEDLLFTRKATAAADAVGVPLLDHVVVGRDGYVSLMPQIESERWVTLQEEAACAQASE